MKVSRAASRLAAVACLCALSRGAAPAQTRQSVKPGTTVVKPVVPEAVKKAMAAFNHALALHRQKKAAAAIAAYLDFLRQDAAAPLPPPFAVAAFRNLAALYGYKHDLAGLEYALQNLTHLDPTDAGALTQLATLDSAKRDHALASQEARKALALKPPTALAAADHFVIGVAAVAHGDTATASRELSEATRLAPENAQAQYDYAVVLFRAGKAERALHHAEAAARLAPTIVPPHMLAGQLKAATKDVPGALAEYETAIRLDPKNPFALFDKAVMLEKLNRTQDAISAYLDVLNVDPKSESAHLNVAGLYIGLGNNTAARLHYSAAHRMAPSDTKALAGLAMSETQDALSLADSNQRTEELRQAEVDYKQLLSLKPQVPGFVQGLGSLYERTGRYDAALSIYRQWISSHPKDIEGYRSVARVYLMQHQIDPAVAAWREYRAHVPDDPTSYDSAATLLETAGKPDAAIAEWQALLARNPKDGNAMLAIAQDLVRLKRTTEAQNQYRAVLALDAGAGFVHDPRNRSVISSAIKAEQIDAMKGLAHIAETAGNMDEAVRWLEQAKAREAAAAAGGKSEDAATYTALARDYAAEKKYDQAAREYEDLAAVAPKDPAPYEQLAQMDETRNRLDDAAVAYRRAAERAPDPVDALLKLADLFRRNRRFNDALAVFQELAKAHPHDARIFSPMAQTYEQVGDDAHALTAYDSLVKIDPTAHWAEDKKAVVLTRLKRYPEARAIYEADLDRDPESYQTYADLGRLYGLLGQSAAYLPWLQHRLEAAPANTTLMSAISDQYISQKRESDGWAYLKKVADAHAADRTVQQAYAQLLNRQGKKADALDVYRRLAAANPKDLNAQSMLVDQLDFNEKQDEANKLLESLSTRADLTAVERNGIIRELADRYARQGKHDQAIATYRRALQVNPQDYFAVSSLASELVAAGRPTEAIPLYQGLLSRKTWPPTVRAEVADKLAGIYEAQGRKPEAIAEYRDALQIMAGDPVATASLKRLGAP